MAGLEGRTATIDGLIGAGKSTLLEALRDKGKAVTLEPVHDWSLLQDFYEDPERWCFAFQVQIALSMAATGPCGGFVERSPVSALAFVHLNRQRGNLTAEEAAVYTDLHRRLFPWCAGVRTVFLDVPPETCMKRIRQRNRDGEDRITLEYLEQLREAHFAVYRLLKIEPIIIRPRHADTPEMIAAQVLAAT